MLKGTLKLSLNNLDHLQDVEIVQDLQHVELLQVLAFSRFKVGLKDFSLVVSKFSFFKLWHFFNI